MAASDEFRLTQVGGGQLPYLFYKGKSRSRAEGMWEAIESGYSEEMTDKEMKVDNKALAFLFLVVEDNYLDDIGESKTAREAWTTLEEMHSKFGLLHILQVMRDFFNVRMKKEESMQSYLGRLMELHRKLSSAGHAFTDREVTLVMLMGLPAAYEPLILNLEQDEEQLCTKVVKTRLLIEEKKRRWQPDGRSSFLSAPREAAAFCALRTVAMLHTPQKLTNLDSAKCKGALQVVKRRA
ncbi:hypothetical protein HPB48_015137 [Haemaphysalis longicornis]|uniref:Uncharacterized protein n=1 Tax=Haemaphysalis longicornis TaxID=44386 RepID=A0A9J6GLM2_HAELO|nr:hypothetical protein HPB48_015137 [Haemaphysalis longicornis]